MDKKIKIENNKHKYIQCQGASAPCPFKKIFKKP
jgi:hypothetical protein